MTVPDPDSDLVASVERYLTTHGWSDGTPSDLTLTDVLVVAVRRGFDSVGSKSQTITLTPTESSVPMLMGMANYARLRFDKMANESFTDKGD